MTHYAKRKPWELDKVGGYYHRHVAAMTEEDLHSKADIAAELGWRDMEIDRLHAALEKVLAESCSPTDFVIRFGSNKARQHFKLWLCESGEQSYWDWMACRERREPGDITAVEFKYHRFHDYSTRANEREFNASFPIEVVLGRLDREDEGVTP